MNLIAVNLTRDSKLTANHVHEERDKMRVTEPYIIFPRKLKSGAKVYYFQFRDENGHRSFAQSTGETSHSKALRFVQKLYNEGQLKTKVKVTFRNFAHGFFDKNGQYYKWKEANLTTISDSTLKSYVIKLNCQLLPYFGRYELTAIDVVLVKKWVIWASKKWSAKTVNNAQGVLNIILSSALEKKMIEENPLDKITFRKIEKKHRELLTEEEIKQIYNADWTREESKRMFLLAAVTGMRIGECSGLLKECVHDTYLDVKHSYDPKLGLGETKTKLNRFVPVPKGLSLIKEDDCKWVFMGNSSEVPLYSNIVYKNMLRICDKLGIDYKARGITIHSLRNFFISYLQKKNVTEAKIRAVVGHSENTMTELYTYWKPDMFPEVYQAQQELFNYITEAL